MHEEMKVEEIKRLAVTLGADRCGIADLVRFSDAPEGFRPTDIYPGCRSVVVFLKRMPPVAILSSNPIPYTHNAALLYQEIDRIGLNLSYLLEKQGILSMPVPCDVPYLYWDPERMHGMGILSMRHAGRNAGLGFLGRNTLLINPELGNMVYIGALLTNAELEPDPLTQGLSCPDGCSLCLDACPVNALDGTTVNQKLCRGISCPKHARGWELYTCNECRKVCPLRSGI